jgi:hypothetical protein
MPESEAQRQGPKLIDLSALVVGYGLAAMLMKAFWPATRELPGAQLFVAGILFLWLGLAMAGPILFLLNRPSATEQESPETAQPPQRTWAEWTWLLIGSYWIFLTILVVPAMLRVDPMLGVLPILFAILARLLAPQRRWPTIDIPPWTHSTAIGLIWTWPIAWGALVLLGKTLF